MSTLLRFYFKVIKYVIFSLIIKPNICRILLLISCNLLCEVPPKVLIQVGNQAVSISERVLLDCPIDAGDPQPTILWMKNDEPVEINERIQQLQNGSLAIYDSSVSTCAL